MCTVGERGGPAFVLCGDLVRAIRLEVAEAVARSWGVHAGTVSRWRRLLGVERFNPGTHQLFLRYQGKGLTAEATARGRAAQTPQCQVEWAAARRREGRTRKRRWTPAEDALLGTMTDYAVAQRLGCCARTVSLRRHELSIPPFTLSTLAAALMAAADRTRLRYSPTKLVARRLKLGLFQTQVAALCGWTMPAMYQRLESGLQERVTPEVLDKMAAALRCQPTDLLVEEDRSAGKPRKERRT